MALVGSLSEFTLEQVLLLLELGHKTGVLAVTGDGASGALSLSEGALVGARIGEDTGDAALGALFAIRDGSFDFRAGTPEATNLRGSLDDLLHLAEEERVRFEQIRREIPDDAMRFALSERAASGGPISLAPEQWRILLAVDGQRDVRAIAGQCGYARLVTLRHLQGLVGQGLVDVFEPAPRMAPVEAASEATPTEMELDEGPSAAGPSAAAVAEAPPVAEEASPPAIAEPEAPRPEAAEPESPGTMSEAPLSPEPTMEAPFDALAPAPTPDDFWNSLLASRGAPSEAPAAEPSPAEEPTPQPETDERLAALFGAPPSPAAPPLEQAPAEPPTTAASEAEVSHYFPPDATAPILEREAPAPVREEKRGFFGLFGKKVATEAAIPPTPGALAAFANALLSEYNGGAYGAAMLDERMQLRLRRVDEQADPLDRALPLQGDRLDAERIDRELDPSRALPYVATLVRQIYDDAERAFGKDRARKGYRSAANGALRDTASLQHESVAAILSKL